MPRVINPAALRELREAIGIGQRELARRAGLHPGSVSNIEAGRHKVMPDTQRALANALGVPLAAITYPVPEPEEATA